MKRFISVILILFFVPTLHPLAEIAESPLKMKELAIQVMPEYSYHPEDTKKNHPPLLIGYQGTFINQSSQAQKGKIEIPLPDDLKDLRIGFVADYSSNLSEMYEIEYTYDKNSRTISWETSYEIQPDDLYKFVVEFYCNEITQKLDVKNFTYTFKSFADISLVNITFLEPLKTENTRIEPAPENHQQNPYGMNLFLYQLQGVKKGEVKSYQVNYKRSSEYTTVELMNRIAPNRDEKKPEPKEVKTGELFMIIAGVGGFIFVSALLLILFFQKKNTQPIRPDIQASSKGEAEEQKVELRTKLIQGEISKEEYDRLILENG
ncbi:SHOCT domain-containing protein [Pseudoneobacillus sp. C159]